MNIITKMENLEISINTLCSQDNDLVDNNFLILISIMINNSKLFITFNNTNINNLYILGYKFKHLIKQILTNYTLIENMNYLFLFDLLTILNFKMLGIYPKLYYIFTISENKIFIDDSFNKLCLNDPNLICISLDTDKLNIYSYITKDYYQLLLDLIKYKSFKSLWYMYKMLGKEKQLYILGKHICDNYETELKVITESMSIQALTNYFNSLR